MRSFHIRPASHEAYLVAAWVRSIALGNPGAKIIVEAEVDHDGQLHAHVQRVESFHGHEQVVCLAVAWLAEHDACMTEEAGKE